MNKRPANASLLGALLLTGLSGVTAAACNMLIGLEPGQLEPAGSSSASTSSGGGGPGTSVSASEAVSTGSNATGGGGTSSSTSTGSTSSTSSTGSGTTCPSPVTTCSKDPAWAHWNPEPGPGCTERFTTILDTIFDKVTGLTWQRTLPAMTMKWDVASTYCANYSAGGLKGFRLPTRIELVSIADFSRPPPIIDPVAFPNTAADAFWTSSSYATDSTKAWFIAFGQFGAFPGVVKYDEKIRSYYVRCVH